MGNDMSPKNIQSRRNRRPNLIKNENTNEYSVEVQSLNNLMKKDIKKEESIGRINNQRF